MCNASEHHHELHNYVFKSVALPFKFVRIFKNALERPGLAQGLAHPRVNIEASGLSLSDSATVMYPFVLRQYICPLAHILYDD